MGIHHARPLLAIVVAATMAGCGLTTSDENTVEASFEYPGPTLDIIELAEDHLWNLVAMSDPDEGDLPLTTGYTIEFEGLGFGGVADCNEYAGRFSEVNGVIAAAGVRTTAFECDSQSPYLMFLVNAEMIRLIEGRIMELETGDGRRLRFE